MSTTQNDRDEKQQQEQHTVVDRSIQIFLKTVESSPSFKDDDICPQVERLHRLHGTLLLKGASQLLGLGPSTFATSCTMFHRFLYTTSLKDHDVWSVAMACTLLSTKVEEEPRSIRHVILIYNHLYRRRRLCVQLDSVTTTNNSTSKLASLKKEEKENVLRYTPSMSPLGPVYQEWRKALEETEQAILRNLGFTLYWIPDSHPHRFILYFLRLLEVPTNNGAVPQQAWDYCNTACLLPLCVEYPAELVASAAIFLATSDFNIVLPTNPQPWWYAFTSPEHGESLLTVCNAILGMGNQDSELIQRASTTFVPSLIPDGSFNDPDSFIWSRGD